MIQDKLKKGEIKGKSRKRKTDDNGEDDDNEDNDPIKKSYQGGKKIQSFLTCHIGRLVFKLHFSLSIH